VSLPIDADAAEVTHGMCPACYQREMKAVEG
jgi:hypothetical protein